MTGAEMAELAGYLFASWASGYVCGLLVHAFRRMTDMI